MTVSAQSSTIKTRPKQIRLRSVAYPSYTIDAALLTSKKINDEFASINYISAAAISEFIGISGGAFLMKLSSCVQYGFLQLRKGEGYRPTDILNRISKPLPNEKVEALMLQCLMKPDLYRKLFDDFSNKPLPSENGLANILNRFYGLKGNGAKIAAKIFFKNLISKNLLTGANELKVKTNALFESLNNNEDNGSTVIQNSYGVNNALDSASSELYGTMHNLNLKELPIFLPNNREAKLFLPKDFSDEDLNRIIRILNAYLS